MQSAHKAMETAATLPAAHETLAALHKLIALKAAHPNPAALLPVIQERSLPAIALFNAHLEAGEIEEAERYAAALAALIPQGKPILTAALSCNLALGRSEEAKRYARALLAIDPVHAIARAALALERKAAAGGEDDVEQRVALALAGDVEIHPLLRLRDIHDLASAILCRPLTPRGEAQLERLLQEARAIIVGAPVGSDLAGWEKHYRLMLDAFDLEAVHNPDPPASTDPECRLMTSEGEPRAFADLRALASRLKAKTVFFAAADESYVKLYARWYALSVLKRCDVSSLIVIHVVGAAGRLQRIAESVGVRDRRLVFTGDEVDESALTMKCYDTPPKGLIARPVAYYQSARFLRLGALMRAVGLPVFVSDIDLLLQRGVADLLQRSTDADVVLNENEHNMNAGSRLTANLLLLNPTENAARFVRFLRCYLEQSLSRPEVTRWIDQVALTLGRHHLTLHGRGPRIGYFDTNTDINNVIYPSYQAHPFRFLSLYHGFDISSLVGDPRVLGA
jgi:hypothetical protein